MSCQQHQNSLWKVHHSTSTTPHSCSPKLIKNGCYKYLNLNTMQCSVASIKSSPFHANFCPILKGNSLLDNATLWRKVVASISCRQNKEKHFQSKWLTILLVERLLQVLKSKLECKFLSNFKGEFIARLCNFINKSNYLYFI